MLSWAWEGLGYREYFTCPSSACAVFIPPATQTDSAAVGIPDYSKRQRDHVTLDAGAKEQLIISPEHSDLAHSQSQLGRTKRPKIIK